MRFAEEPHPHVQPVDAEKQARLEAIAVEVAKLAEKLGIPLHQARALAVAAARARHEARAVDASGPMAKLVARLGVTSAEADELAMRMKSSEQGGPTTMSEPKTIEVTPATLARLIADGTGAPLSVAQAAVQTRIAAEREAGTAVGPDVVARIEQRKAEKVAAAREEVFELQRRGYSLPEAQAAVLRRRAGER